MIQGSEYRTYLIDSGDCCIHDFPLEGFEYDCLVLYSKLCESNARDNLSRSNIYFLMVEDTNNIPVLSGTRPLDVGKEFVFEVSAHIGSKERRMKRQCQRKIFLEESSVLCHIKEGGEYKEEHPANDYPR